MKFNLYIIIVFLFSFCAIAQGQQKRNLIVFVGEKIESSKVAEIDSNSWDLGGLYRYKILKKVYGNYKGDTIEFEAYDHYGTPEFSNYEHVLLFVSEYEGKFYHEKYQYFDVYKTKNGGWASPGDPYRFDTNISEKKVKLNKEAFLDPVIFDVVNGRLKNPVNITQLDLIFKEPYFFLKDGKACAYEGTCVRNLFNIKKEGVLKARGHF